jgi:aminoglycoside phosphotransferase (APT) family kinase protein
MAIEQWHAEVEISAQTAAALIAERFPELRPRSVAPLGEGWDNAAFLIDDRLVFRFPRRSIAAKLMEIEIAVLPAIAPRLTLNISAPTYLAPARSAASSAPQSYLWPFAGYPLLDGRPLGYLRLAEQAYERVAADVGAFLRTLHALDAQPLRTAGLPDDEFGRLNHERMMPKFLERLAVLQAAGYALGGEWAIGFLEQIAPRGERSNRRVLVHGDLYGRHVLVDDCSVVSGVIDWGDVHYGDPAVDLGFGFEVLPAQARAAFFAAYGSIDRQTLDLARYRALYHTVMVAHYGYRIGDRELLDAGLRGLDYAAL